MLKKVPATAAIAVIALTSMAMQDDRQKATADGCDAYVVKPFHHAGLYAAIDALVLKSGPEAPTLELG